MAFKIEKVGEYKGFQYVITGNSMGFRCGYVGVDESHSMYKKHYAELDFDIHGGLTYSGGGDGYPIESNNWWLGFDCGHCWDGRDFDLIKELSHPESADYFIGLGRQFPTFGEEDIRTVEYVETECQLLISQL